ncbi:MAG: tetratricopeptide repeat protein, partial [Nitrospirota bacterium]
MGVDKNTIIQNAQRYTVKGQIDKAIEEWQKLVKETPNEGNIYNTIGDLYLKRNSIESAMDSYMKAAEVFKNAGFSLKTIAVYKKIIKIDPERLDLYIRLGDLNSERGLITNAVDDYLKAAKHYAREGLLKECLDVYRKIANLDPDNKTICMKIAEICVKEGLYDEATEEYIKIAEELLKQDKTSEVEEIYKQVLAYDSANEKALTGMEDIQKSKDKKEAETLLIEADNLFRESRFDEAEEIINRLIEIDPLETIYNERLGYIFLMRSELNDASDKLMSVAGKYILREEFERAEKIIKDYLELDSKGIEAHKLLANIYEKIGETDKLTIEYSEMIDIYLYKGLKTEAYPIFERLQNILPDEERIERYKEIFKETEEEGLLVDNQLQAVEEQVSTEEESETLIEEAIKETEEEGLLVDNQLQAVEEQVSTEEESETLIEEAIKETEEEGLLVDNQLQAV